MVGHFPTLTTHFTNWRPIRDDSTYACCHFGVLGILSGHTRGRASTYIIHHRREPWASEWCSQKVITVALMSSLVMEWFQQIKQGHCCFLRIIKAVPWVRKTSIPHGEVTRQASGWPCHDQSSSRRYYLDDSQPGRNRRDEKDTSIERNTGKMHA